MRAFIRRHPFLAYYLVAIAFPTVLWTYAVILEINAAQAGQPSPMGAFYETQAEVRAEHPYLTAHRDGVPTTILAYMAYPLAWPFFFFPFAPTVAALLVVTLGHGSAGLRDLLGAYRPWRGDISAAAALKVYGVVLGLLATAGAAIVVGVAQFGTEAGWTKVVTSMGLASPGLFFSTMVVALLMNQGALLEELGWRGYAWPVLARLKTPLVGAVLLGIAWALWHLPREIPTLLAGQQTIGELLSGQVLFIVSCISMTIVAVAFVNLTGGSVWPAILVHGCLNLFFEALSGQQVGARGDLFNASILIWLVLAAGVLAVLGRGLGWQRRLAIHGGDGSHDPANRWAPVSRAGDSGV